MDIHNLTAKDIKKLHIWLRALIQVLYFLFIPSVYTAAFAGVKYIFTQISAGEKVAMTSFVTVLVVICIYTILFGRFFCGFACAFGTLGDGVHALYVWICKKMKKKPLQIAEINVVSAEKEDGAYLSMAKDIIPKIIDAQSADVDTVSGATFSSTGIKNASEQALEKAVK